MAEPLHATFFAFRKREPGGVLLGASISFFVIMFLSLIAFGVLISMAMGANPLAMFTNPAMGADPARSANVLNNIGVVLLAELGFLVFFFVVLAAYEAACLRWMIRGERPGLFGLTLDADTWRVYGTYWLWLIFLIVGYIVLVLLAMLLAMIGGAVARDNVAVGISVAVIVFLFSLFAPIFVLVRFAPASATSVGTGRFAFFDAWRVTEGRFWSLFGAYFLLWIIYLIVALGMWIVWFASAADLSGVFGANSGDPAATSQAWSNAMMNAFTSPTALATYWVLQIFGYVVWLFFAILLNGVNARAVMAAADDGKIDGVVSIGLAKTFE